MTLLFIRSFFFILSAVVGYYIGMIVDHPMLGAELGALSGLLLIFLEQRLHRISLHGLSSMVFGLLLGVFMAKLISDILTLISFDRFFQSVSRVVLTIVFSYLGTVVALRGKDEFNIVIPYVRFRRQDVSGGSVLLDTSAIIDGRIVDIYKTNFLTGRLVVPRCVLTELQKIADSSDEGKRQRGRRGMELLRTMQSDPKVQIHIHEDELTDEKEVDGKLIKLAKMLDAKICTTDFNLGRIAALQGIGVLNIHELGNAVKSVVYAGETLNVKLVREGKEPGQALAHLDDGTMVVVGEARHLIGKTVDVHVVSVLQTQSGKIIFAKLV
ncbi:MAG TPA: TRAM domain-containing protein [Candidatus Omnitrophota bacterium]|nr:TRAM domain-containing protein [Candidatus Omnitrophota bacterium]